MGVLTLVMMVIKEIRGFQRGIGCSGGRCGCGGGQEDRPNNEVERTDNPELVHCATQYNKMLGTILIYCIE